MKVAQYFYADSNGEPVGPFSRSDLERMLASGILSREASIRSEENSEWAPVGSVLPKDTEALIHTRDEPNESSGVKSSYQEIAEKLGFVPDFDRNRNLIQIGITLVTTVVFVLISKIMGGNSFSWGFLGFVAGVLGSGAFLMVRSMQRRK